ncbi:TRAFs-binding domain-containing protein [Rhodoblastus sp.]|uniref:TRAFs-binding domain-containing protein n=1 Tax=Rhodoblastus sp. TaxID=1962975 RepID=UPI003F9980F8
MPKTVCFIIMPFGRKQDAGGRYIDFDAVHARIIAPAVRAAGFEPMRADQELTSGVIHRAMFERLVLSNYAVADLTIANANVFYELGVRHAARPQTTALLCADASRLPFDVAQLHAMPYALDPSGEPARPEEDCAQLTKRLVAARDSDRPDSPLYALLNGFSPPQVPHEKTDLFREQVEKARSLKQKLREARGGGHAKEELDAIAASLGDLRAEEAEAVIDLFLAFRDIKAWDRMIELYRRMDPVLANTLMAREQYAFALNRARRDEEAEQVLTELIEKRGPSSETYGLLGRVYKDRWRDAKKQGDELMAEGFLDQAIEAYRKGFEADWRDAFPGVNACTLMELRQPGDPAVKELVAVARYAAERKIARGAGNYWDYATLLELAILERDDDRTRKVLARVLAEKNKLDSWSPETTAANLRDIAQARRAGGEDVKRLEEIIARLDPPAAG